MKGHKLKVKAEVFKPKGYVAKKKKERADSIVNRDPSSREIKGHFMKEDCWMVTKAHLGALPMSFSALSLVLAKTIEKSCCREELLYLWRAQNTAPKDTGFESIF